MTRQGGAFHGRLAAANSKYGSASARTAQRRRAAASPLRYGMPRSFQAARPRPCARQPRNSVHQRTHASGGEQGAPGLRGLRHPPDPGLLLRARPTTEARRACGVSARASNHATAARQPRAAHQLRDGSLLEHRRVLQHVRQQDVAVPGAAVSPWNGTTAHNAAARRTESCCRG